MFNKKLFIILLVLCCVLFAALFLNNDKNRYETDYSDTFFLPDLKNQLTDVAKIQIESVAESVVLENKNNSWVVSSKHDYPADTNLIRQLIYGIADLKIIEAKTNDETLLAKIGLTLDSEESVRIWLTDKGGQTISDLLFGKSQVPISNQGQDWFARHFKENQSWQLNGEFELNKNAYQWLNKTVLALKTDEIQEVVLHANSDDSLLISNVEGTQSFELQGITDSEKVEAFKLDEIIESASAIQLDDVRVKSTQASNTEKESIQIKTKSGLSVDIRIVDTDQGWISLKATSKSDDKTVQDQSQALNHNWSSWEFQIPGYKLDSLLQTKPDLLIGE